MESIAEILKNAPKGLRLYSPAFGYVRYVGFMPTSFAPNGEKAITVENDNKGVVYFLEDGRMSRSGECLLFPSQYAYTQQLGWEQWRRDLLPRSAGSVIVDTCYGGLFIITSDSNAKTGTIIRDSGGVVLETSWGNFRYATEEETRTFFSNLEYHGYCWDEDTKDVVKKTKFKVGDFVVRKNTGEILQIVGMNEYSAKPNYTLSNGKWVTDVGLTAAFEKVKGEPGVKALPLSEDDNKFTINDLKPFDKVLVRSGAGDKWHINLFEDVMRNEDKGGIIEYLCMDDGYFGQCVPYNDETARLLRTAEDYNGKYKTW